jgi:hypothetical protein
VSRLIGLWFVYGPLEGHTVYLRPVRGPYGLLYSSSIVYWKAAWFIYGPLEGRTVHFTDRKQDLQPAWSTVLREDFLRISFYFIVLFLRISFIFYGFIFIYFAFYSFIKVNYKGYIQAVLFLKYR